MDHIKSNFMTLNMQLHISYMNYKSDHIKFQIYACIYISCEHELEIVLDQKIGRAHV